MKQIAVVVAVVLVGAALYAQGLVAPSTVSVGEAVYSSRGELVGVVDKVQVTPTKTVYRITARPKPPTPAYTHTP